jgi:hypothetical protein
VPPNREPLDLAQRSEFDGDEEEFFVTDVLKIVDEHVFRT